MRLIFGNDVFGKLALLVYPSCGCGLFYLFIFVSSFASASLLRHCSISEDIHFCMYGFPTLILGICYYELIFKKKEKEKRDLEP